MHRLVRLATLAVCATSLLSGGLSRVEAVPPPPPPPPFPKHPEMALILREAEECFYTRWEKGYPLHHKALAATRGLKVLPGSAAWERARESVVSYIKQRRTLLPCIAQLETMKPREGWPYADWVILKQRVAGMRRDYSGQTRFELMLTLSLLDSDLAQQEITLPY